MKGQVSSWLQSFRSYVRRVFWLGLKGGFEVEICSGIWVECGGFWKVDEIM